LDFNLNGFSWKIMENRQWAVESLTSKGFKSFAVSRYDEVQRKFGYVTNDSGYKGGPHYIVFGDLKEPRYATIKSSFLSSYVIGVQKKLSNIGMIAYVGEVSSDEEIPIAAILEKITFPNDHLSHSEKVKLDLLPPKWVDGEGRWI
jgi:hypothetical protein